ncbi:MAG: hypothetical protein ACOX60_07425 [Massiliimalia sp.]|jgi:DNA-binding response OmpR family regulator
MGTKKNVVGSHVRMLRRKIGMNEGCTIRCVWEIGYCFESK